MRKDEHDQENINKRAQTLKKKNSEILELVYICWKIYQTRIHKI